MIRDKFNFNEYIIPFDLTAKQLELSGNLTDIKNVFQNDFRGEIDSLEKLTGVCIGEDCCDTGTIYDIENNTCTVRNSREPATT